MNRLIMIMAGILLCALFFSFGSKFNAGWESGNAGDLVAKPLIATAVDWQPWEQSAFARAQRENKLVFLNLSPFWCGQCSLMDRDAYNNEAVATALNQNFVPIRVDPERRPDIGDRYHLGGFPSCVILTSKGDMVGGGTFLPSDSLAKLLANVEHYWQSNHDFVMRQAKFLRVRYQRVLDSVMIGAPSNAVLAKADQAVTSQYDSSHSGFGVQPKFLQPEVVEFMLNTSRPDGTPQYAEQLTGTLDAQLALLDTVWGGFYRYARFADWGDPSTEKLLTANAKMLSNYLDAYLATKRQEYRVAAEDVIAYVNRFLRSEREWGFCNSQHADVPDAEHYLMGEAYYLGDGAQRETHGIPPVDPSIYTDANCLAVRAYLKAGRVLGRQDCLSYAIETLTNLVGKATDKDGAVYHDPLHHESAPRGLLADQLGCATALVDAYETTGRQLFLDQAIKIVGYVEANLVSPAYGGLEIDEASPTGIGRMAAAVRPFGLNCTAVNLYMKLHHLTADAAYYEKAARIVNYLFRAPLASNDLRFCQLADTWLWFTRYPAKFIMVGPHGPEYDSLVAATWGTYYPRSVMVHLEPGANGLKLGDLSFPASDRPLLFVCDATLCSVPIDDPVEAPAEIREFLQSGM